MATYSVRPSAAFKRRVLRSHPSVARGGSLVLRHEVSSLLRRRLTGGLTLASLMLALALPQNVKANPENGTVTAGNAIIVNASPDRLNVLQSSDRAIINWQGFSIGQGERTDFQQPSASSVTLNRVTGKQASQIAGSLTANGTVMLVNPNGGVIGKTGTVDVAGLVATTANIRDDDFLAQRLNFGAASPNAQAAVRNEGRITVKDQGLAALVAPRVENSGVIQARLGTVALGGAQTFSLDFQGDGLLSFSAGSAVAVAPQGGDGSSGSAPALVTNSGRIIAAGGTVQLAASAVKDVVDHVIDTSGIVEARTVEARDGKIILSGGDSGQVAVTGTLDASAEQGHGGSVQINGEIVSVAGNAHIDVSGASGGGNVDIGHTDGAELAQSVSIDRGTRIDANAVAQGDGGSVVVLSSQSTAFAGSISARGGSQGGNGGSVEISSRDRIGLSGSVDLNAPHGITGSLLLDPATLTIVDSGAGTGQQDAAAGDGTISAGDGNTPDNTVSRGTLEALSGSTNLTLEATGLITIDAMAGNLINLQTDASHSFTLRSTTAGGIHFLNPNTEIRTQGGDISLQALKTGALLNVGKLTSNGGDISLLAGGLVELAGNLTAGAGNVSVTSLSNSIQRIGNATVSGASVTVDASYGSVGAAGAEINTSTGDLTLATGGDLLAVNDTPLSRLSITSVHTVDRPFVYQVSAPQLSFDVTDTGSAYQLTSIANASNLDLTFRGDRDLIVGNVNAVGSNVVLATSAGSILDDGDAATGIVGSGLTLSATGALGSDTNSLTSTTAALAATAGSGGVFVNNTGALDLSALAAGNASAIVTTGDLTLHTVAAAGTTLSLTSSGGSVFTAGGPNDTIAVQTLNLSGSDAIGTIGAPILTTATTLSATAANGIYAGTTGATTLRNVTSSSGPIEIVSAGDMSVDTVDASTGGAVSLTATNGSITAVSGSDPNVVANTFDFSSTAPSGNVNLRTAATIMSGAAGSGGINLTQAGATTLANLSTTGSLQVASSSGDMILSTLQAGATATLSTAAGNVLDDGDNATALTANAAIIAAPAGLLGTSANPLQTKTPSLTLTSGSDIYVNSDRALSTLNITDTHVTAGAVNTLVVSAPYLEFDVVDSGSQFLLNEITGQSLNTLSFTGDQEAVLTKLYATGSVSVRAMHGNLLNDGDDNTRVTGSSVSLRADHGNLGTADPNGALDTNTSTLTAGTAGNLYINDISDLSSLSLSSTHEVPTQDYQFILTAPALHFDITDSATGYALTNVSDVTSLNLSFQGDRTITAGTIDVTRSGTVVLSAAQGSVLDDGDKNTRILGDTVTLNSTSGDVGSTAAGAYMDVIARQLQGSSPNGSYTVVLPYSANTTNSNGAVTLNSINAGGPASVVVDNGDLRVNSLTSGEAVALTTSNGSILSSTTLRGSSLTLTASGAIGLAATPLQTQVNNGNVTATAAGGLLNINNAGAVSLLTATAAGPLTFATTGDLTAGAVDAGANAVSLTASSSLQDDSDTNTRVVGSSATLTAQSGSLGTSTAAIGVTSPNLSITSGGDVYVDDSVGVDALSVAGSVSSSGKTNVYSLVIPGLTLSATDDGSVVTLANLANATPLEFGFSTQRTLRVGAIDSNTGSVSLGSVSGNVIDDGDAATTINAPALTLTAGNSIGATGAGNALAINATTLDMTAGRDFFVDDSAALTALALTSTAFAGTANTFGITAAGQTFTLTDNGSTHYLQTVSGPGLGDFSFTSHKNLNFGTVSGTGAVTLVTSGGNSSMTMDGVVGSRISGSSVTLNTLNSTGGHIGTSGASIAVSTPSLTLSSPGNMYVSDNQALTALAVKQVHPSTSINYSTVVAASGLSFALADGNTVALSNVASSGLNFSYETDRALQVGDINVGAGGSVALTGVGTFQTLGIQDDGNQSTRITAGSVSLNSLTGYVGSSGNGDIEVTTANLAVKSTGDVYINDSSNLSSLSLDVTHSNSGDRVYSVVAPGLTFSIADQNLLVTGGQGTVINNLSESALDFSFATDRSLQVVSMSTGVTGSVSLRSNSINDDNNDATRIVANRLTLLGGTAGASPFSTLKELDSTVNILSTGLTGSLNLINTGDLTLAANSVASTNGLNGFATITSLNGSFLSDGVSRFVTPNLTLTADNGSIGQNGNPLLMAARSATLQSGNDIFADDSLDMVALSVNNSHAAVRTNTLSVAAPNLTFQINDVGGAQYDLVNVQDSTGVDFSFTGDKPIQLITADVRGGNTLSVTSNGGDIFDDGDGSTELTGEVIRLAASGSIGRSDPVEVNATNLSLTTNGDLNVHDNLDLSALNIFMAVQSAPTYTLTAPNLNFDVVDDGTTTTVNDISDTDGLLLSLRTSHSQSIQTIDTQRYGGVSLYSDGSIEGSGSPAARINTATAVFETSSGGGIGTMSNPIELSAPQLTLQSTGDIYIDSDRHIDRLNITNRHGNLGTYSIVSPSLTFNVTDSGSGVALNDITDITGLNLNYSADHDFTIGTIDLGTRGNLSLSATTGGVDFLGDGDSNTLITAAGVNLNTTSGAIGAAGAGNELNISAQNFSGFAGAGGVQVGFEGPVVINSIYSTGGSVLSDDGDLSIGSYNANNQSLTVNAGGSILSGQISDTSTLTLNAGGGIGTVSAVTTNANGGTTTLNATAANGGIALTEGWSLNAANLVATGPVTLSATHDLSVGTINAAGSPVTLSAGQGSITGNNGSNLITGSAVTLSANYSQAAQSIGTAGTAVRVATPELSLNARGNLYVADTVDLDSLSIVRSSSSSGAPGGALSISAPSLTFTASDNGSTTVLTNVTDTTGLTFALTSYSDILVNTLNVGVNSDVTLVSDRFNTSGNIGSTGGSPLLTARTLNLTTGGGDMGAIGTSGTPLRTAIANLNATAQGGGICVSQSGALTLNNVNSGGPLSVVTTSGDLTVGSVSYGNNQPLTLSAAAASLLDDGVNSTRLQGSGSGAINLSAANGIGTATNPFAINDLSNNNINADVTGAGSAYLDIVSNANPLVNITASNGSIDVQTEGMVTLANLVSSTDAAGNNITALARSGNLGLGVVTAGAQHGSLDLRAPGGAITALNSSNSISAFDPTLVAASGIGSLGSPLNVTGQNIVADTLAGDIALSPTGAAVLGFVRTLNGFISVTGTSDIVAANVLADTGGINLTTSGSNATIYAGNVNAGSGAVTLSAANGRIVDDGVLATVVAGGLATLTAASDIGTSLAPLQTQLTGLAATVSGNGGIYIDQTGGNLALGLLSSGGGPIRIVGSDSLTGGNGPIISGGAPIVLVANGGGVQVSGPISSVGADATQASVDITGDTIEVGAVTTTGDQQYHAATTVNGDLSGRAITIDGDLTVDGGGTRQITTNTSGQTIAINGGVEGQGTGLALTATGGTVTIDGDASNLSSFASTADQTSLQNVATTGAQTYSGSTSFNGTSYTTEGGDFNATDDTVFSNNTSVATNGGNVAFGSTIDGAVDLTVDAGSGAADFSGAIGSVTPLHNVIVNSGGLTTFGGTFNGTSLTTDAPGSLVIVGSTMQTTGAQSYGEAFTLNNDKTFTGTLITFGGAVNGTTSGQETLDVVGDATFNGGAGGTVALQSLSVTGNAGVSGIMSTTLDQQYGGAIALVGDTTFTLGNGISFASTIDGAHAMTVNAGSSDVSFGRAVGGTAAVGDVVVNTTGATNFNGSVSAASLATDAGGVTNLNGGSVTTMDTQTYGDAVILASDATLAASSVDMQGTLDDVSAGQHALVIEGDSVFEQAVGSTAALKSLSVNGASRINGGSVTTTAGQTYNGSTELGADTTLTGSTIAARDTVDAAPAGQQALNIVGDADFGGNVGTTQTLRSVDVSGTTRLDGDVSTTGHQSYSGAITLAGNSTLNIGSGGITFESIIDGSPAPQIALATASKPLFAPSSSGGQALTVNAGTDDVTFNAAVGEMTRVGDVIVNTGGATTFNAPVYANSVTTDVPGTVALNGRLVDTLGTQSYGEIVTIGADTVLTASTVNLHQAVDDVSAGQHSLAINGDAVFEQAVGSNAELQSLSVSGTSMINGGKVTTAASQTYSGGVTLGTDTELSSGDSVDFGSTIDATNLASLNIAAPAGSVSVGGAIGGVGPLNEFTVASGRNATFDGAITVGDLHATAGNGTTQFNGPVTATTGAIAVENSNGGVVEFGPNASSQAATGFMINGPGAVHVASNINVTQGPISFSGPLTLTGREIDMSTDGNIGFAGVAGPDTLLQLSAGTGYITGGTQGGSPDQQMVLRDMVINSASGAQLYGSLSGIGGGGTAKFVKSGLFGPPYYFNDVPFGPLEFVDRVVVQSARQDVNTGRHLALAADSEHTGDFPETGQLDLLRAPLSPELLTVKGAADRCSPTDGRTSNRTECEVRIIRR